MENFNTGRNSLRKLLPFIARTFDRFQSFDKYAQFLEIHGFTSISGYWHRPNFKTCKEIVPLDSKVALQFAFSKLHGSLIGQFKIWFGKLLKDFGLLFHLIPYFSIVARKQ